MKKEKSSGNYHIGPIIFSGLWFLLLASFLPNFLFGLNPDFEDGRLVAAASSSVPPSSTPGVISFTSESNGMNEGTTITLYITRLEGTDGEVQACIRTRPGTAISPEDFIAIDSCDYVWGEGEEGNKPIAVTAPNNEVADGNKAFTMEIYSVSGAARGTPYVRTITILDDELPSNYSSIVFSEDTFSVSENEEFVRIHLSRTENIDQGVFLNVRTFSQLATSPNDFQNVDIDNFPFLAGRSSTYFDVPINDDGIEESTEYFIVRLYTADRQSMLDEARVFIADNDEAATEAEPDETPKNILNPNEENFVVNFIIKADGSVRITSDDSSGDDLGQGESHQVLIEVYNLRGEKVATLMDSTVAPGAHQAEWNGKNEDGSLVASDVI